MRIVACVVAAGVCLVAAASADAGTVSCTGVVHFQAYPGEANRIELRLLPGDVLSLSDQGAPLTNDGSCSQVGPNEIHQNLRQADLQTGDGDDTISSSG